MAVIDINDLIIARCRDKARSDYRIAGLIGVAVNAPDKFPANLSTAFPELFYDTENNGVMDWRISYEDMKVFQKLHNEKFLKGEKNDS